MAIRNGWTKDDIEVAIAAGDCQDLIRIPICVSMDPPDCAWAEAVCVRLARHTEAQVRANAILGFAHLARVCGRLNESIVRPIIEAGLREPPPVYGQAVAAADDVEHFLGWAIQRP